jgi:hypothetical protein
VYIPQEVTNSYLSRTCLEKQTIEGDSPVDEKIRTSVILFPSTTGHGKPCGNLARPWVKAKYILVTDSEQVPRGKGEKYS